MPRNPVKPEEKTLVRALLKRGKKNALSARKIANETNLRSDRTDVRVRSIISSLIEEDEIAIGSFAKGYYIISNDEELAEVLDGLQVRIEGMARRRACIRQNYNTP
jgi:hypothetical protein